MADFAFIDSETRSRLDVTKVGARQYAEHPTTDVSVWAYGLDDDWVSLWSPPWAWGGTDNEPTALLDHIENGGYLVAWNAFFDRWVYECVMPRLYGWPMPRRDQWLCAQAQAEANQLPGSLEKACLALGTAYKKDPQGKSLIELLAHGTRDDFDRELWHEKMARFRAYGMRDVQSMREVWQYTRPLTVTEWAEYHVSERINDRGVAVDRDFARAAAKFAAAEQAELNGELEQLLLDAHEIRPDEATNAKGELFGPVFTVSNHKRKALWLHEWLADSEELQTLTKRPPKRKDGPPRYSCDRSTREAVLDMLAQPDYRECFSDADAGRVEQFLEIIEAGNSAAVAKYSAIANLAHHGRVHGAYAFNGAGGTGRFSSRGAQLHNLVRDPLDYDDADRALDAIDDILDGAEAEELRQAYGLPVSRLLARLLRPTFVAPEGRTLVWGDWGQIEGRTCPWLADSPGSRRKVGLYASGEDVYRYAAMPAYGLTRPEDVDSQQRQVGKVMELSLQFGGATGALAAMGRGYGVVLPEGEARRIVDTWRATNPWARSFWDELWSAAISAYKNPGTWYRAGRVHYAFAPHLMRGTLICQLPDERWLVYPQFKHEKRLVIEVDDDGTEREVLRTVTSYVKGFGGGAARVGLWYGVLCENVTQAIAASILRRALGLAEQRGLEVVLHTHDEIVVECDERDVERVKALLTEVMLDLADWGDGIPLAVDIESGPYYTK